MKSRLIHYFMVSIGPILFIAGFWLVIHFGAVRDVEPRPPGPGFVAR